MTWLSDQIRRRVNALGNDNVTQKDIAVRFHTAYVGRADKPSPNPKTLAEDLSRLCNDPKHDGGIFLRDEEGRAAFTEALGVESAWLTRLIEANRTHRYLVLDPRLPHEVRDYLVRQEGAEEGRYSCVTVGKDGPDGTSSTDVRAAIREAARVREGAIVVLASAGYEEALFFQGAGVETTGVTKQLRGWTLNGRPDLVPFPPTAPASLVDTHGRMLLPSPQMAELVRAITSVSISNRGSRLEHFNVVVRDRTQAKDTLHLDDEGVSSVAKAIHLADLENREPSFELQHVAPFLLARANLASARRVYPSSEPIAGKAAIAAEQSAETVWWTAIDRKSGNVEKLFVVGPARESVAAVFRPHVVAEPESFAAFRSFMQTRNPLLFARSSWWAEWLAVCERVEQETNFDLKSWVLAWRASMDNGMSETRRCAIRPVDQATIEGAMRAEFATVLARDYDLTPGEASWWFTLAAAATAPWVVLPTQDAERVHFLANFGGGHLARVRLARFPNEASQPLRRYDRQVEAESMSEKFVRPDWAGYHNNGPSISSENQAWVKSGVWFELDGGDIHVWIEHQHAQLLKGMAIPASAAK